jgi:hypothetical protein
MFTEISALTKIEVGKRYKFVFEADTGRLCNTNDDKIKVLVCFDLDFISISQRTRNLLFDDFPQRSYQNFRTLEAKAIRIVPVMENHYCVEFEWESLNEIK